MAKAPYALMIISKLLQNFNNIFIFFTIYEKRRDEYYRLYFLSDSELFQLIAFSNNHEKFSPFIVHLFPTLVELIVEGYEIVGVKAVNDEKLIFKKPIPYAVDDIPLLFKDIEEQVEETLKSEIARFYHRIHLLYSYSTIKNPMSTTDTGS